MHINQCRQAGRQACENTERRSRLTLTNRQRVRQRQTRSTPRPCITRLAVSREIIEEVEPVRDPRKREREKKITSRMIWK